MTVITLRARTAITAAGAEPLSDIAVVIADGVVQEVAPWGASSPRGDVVDVAGLLVPGFVDAHSHLRGLPLIEHGISPRAFESWICSLQAASTLDAGDEALVASTELLETGVTAVQAFLDTSAGAEPLASARAAVTGATEAGIRALVMLSLADRALRRPEPPMGDWARVDPGIPPPTAEVVPELIEEWLATPTSDRVKLGVGATGAQWATDALLDHIAAVSDVRLHTHLHESRLHRSWLAGELSPFERLDSRGMVGPRLSAAHAVHLNDDELDRIAVAGATLIHCPLSNEALRVGTARVGEWLSRDISAGLGVDSQNDGAPDFFDVMRAAQRVSEVHGERLSETAVLTMATIGGAHALGIAGGGRIAPGSPADFIELDSRIESDADVVLAGSRDAVTRVWVGGSLVVDGGRSVVDASAARARSRAALAADASARAVRLQKQKATLELVDSLVEGM